MSRVARDTYDAEFAGYIPGPCENAPCRPLTREEYDDMRQDWQREEEARNARCDAVQARILAERRTDPSMRRKLENDLIALSGRARNFGHPDMSMRLRVMAQELRAEAEHASR